MLYNLTSIKEVIGRIIRNTRISDTSYISDMHEWIPEAVGFMKTKMSLVPKKGTVDVHFHSGQFPCGLHTLTGVYYKGERLRLRSSSCGNWYDTIPGGIQTSICDGTLDIHFLSLPLDAEGFPLIPDNEDYKQALYYYVREMMVGAGYEDKVYNVDKLQALFELHAARAMGQIRYPSVDMMASRIPSITRYLPYNYAGFFGLASDDCGDSNTLSAFGLDLSVNGGQSNSGNGSGGGTNTTVTVIEKEIQYVYRNNSSFEYEATGTEGTSIVVPELIGKVILELFRNSYLLSEEKTTAPLTPNSFKFEPATGRLSFSQEFTTQTPPEIVQGLYTTES